jgi:hypothetical protein
VVDRSLSHLRQDLDSGDWDRRYGDLRMLDACDVGLRLIHAEIATDIRS